MIAPYKWLRDYTDIDVLPEELTKKLIMTGTQVEGYTELGENVKDIIVGKILTIKKHPDADKLSVCTVDVGKEELQIVCGAHNIFEGALVPVATIGAKLPYGITISKSKLRGVYSFGMLCSGKELGLTNSDYSGADVDGIMILKEDYKLGTSLREILGLDDIVLEIEVGANRPDCLSITGVARECAAAINKTVKMPVISYKESGGNISDYVKVSIQDSDLCERYIARAVKNVKIAPSPKWLRDRLITAGVRSINNIVDITNFVMLETGQPMHAFDYKNIRGKEIIVRRAKNNENITTLDGKVRSLTSDMLLICDAEGAIGIAGVMGGENSEIKDDTTTVIFESARFLQGNVRRTARGLGLQTESAMRFSKGVDIVGCKTAMDRALDLIEKLGAGEIVSGEIDILSADIAPKTVVVSSDKINKRLGTSIATEEMAAQLRRIFIETKVDSGNLICSIPSYRGDISIGEDIAEEVARMYGYDNIPLTKMTGEIKRGMIPAREKSIDRIKALLKGLGYNECLTYSFASLSDIDKLGVKEDDKLRNMVTILNPLGDEQKYMRTSPLPEMLRSVANNLNKKVTDIKLFDIARTYMPVEGEKLPFEQIYAELALCSGDDDFLKLKGIVENIFQSFGIKKYKFVADGPDYYHPYRKAYIYSGDIKLGEIGEVYQDAAAAYGINKRVSVSVLWLNEILVASDDSIKFEPLPKFPAVQRDIALIVDSDVPAGDILECARENAGVFFESAELFDVYKGGQLGEGKKSIAFSVILRAKDRTLLDEEANGSRDAIVKAAAARFGAKLRE